MIIILLPLAVWSIGWLLSWLVGAPPHEGMLVVLLSALLAKIDGPWIYSFVYLVVFWVLIFRWIARLVS